MWRVQRLPAAIGRHAAQPMLHSTTRNIVPAAVSTSLSSSLRHSSRSLWTKLLRPDAERDPRRPLQPWDASLKPVTARPSVAEPHPRGWGGVEEEKPCPECWAAAAGLATLLGIVLFASSDEESRAKAAELIKRPKEMLTSEALFGKSRSTLEQQWESFEDQKFAEMEQQEKQQRNQGTAAAAAAAASSVVAASSAPFASSPSGRKVVVAMPSNGRECAVCVDVASLPRRFCAFVLDGLVVQSVLAFAFVLSQRLLQALATTNADGSPVDLGSAYLLRERFSWKTGIVALAHLVYEVILAVRWDGQTIGKRALSIRIRRRDFAEMDVWTALQFSVWRLAAGFTGPADLIPLCLAEQRRDNVLLHNYLSRTIVVHEREQACPPEQPVVFQPQKL